MTAALPAVATLNGEARQWEIILPAGLEVLSLNGREHWAARNRKVQALKDAAIVMTRKAGVPQLEYVEFTVIYDPPDGRHRDPDNLVASAKAAIDGAAWVVLPHYGKRRPIAGDDSRHVARVSCEIGPEPFPRGRLRMIITELRRGAPA